MRKAGVDRHMVIYGNAVYGSTSPRAVIIQAPTYSFAPGDTKVISNPQKWHCVMLHKHSILYKTADVELYYF